MKRALLVLWLMLHGVPAAAKDLPVPAPLVELGVDERAGAAIPLDVEVVDARGNARRLEDYFRPERPVVLMLTYSKCPMLCNLVLRGVAEALGGMRGRIEHEFALVNISLDPEESPHGAARGQAVMAEVADLEHPEQWPFVVAEESELQRLTGALGFRYARDRHSGQIAHPSVLFVLSPDGTLSRAIHGVRYPPAELEAAIDEARVGRFRVAATLEAVMSCFRFDPAGRKYGWLVMRSLQALALAMVLALLVTGLMLFRKGRRT